MSKPREYWIELEKEDPCESLALVHFSEHDKEKQFYETIHVIEISAVTERDEIIEELLGALGDYFASGFQRGTEEKRLESRYEKARERIRGMT